MSYATYTYNCCAEITATTSWHPGQHVTLHWTAQAGAATTDSTPHPLTLRVTLTGPFQTVDGLKQTISQGRMPSGIRSIDAVSPAVTDRTGGVPASELDLPADLAPGYYNLSFSVGSNGNSMSAASVVTIG